MYSQLAFATLAVVLANDFAFAQNQIPSSTTAGELWNPWTWFWPYAIATAEGYRDYYEKAQKATNELYQQIYKTNAFPWVTGNWGPQIYPPGNGQNNQNNQNDKGQENQNNQNNQNDQGQNNQNDQGQNNQNNPTGDNGQNNSDGDNQTGNNDQSNPTDQNNQAGEDNTADNQGGETNQNAPGAQVQGGAQGDGSADAQVNGSV